ncbi:MAG TPA: hypothetical protein VGU61_07565 [Noviherbaspirillum sp.]|jgi:hypothetical protein|uniref:hypothetical protein n=1 Tax=Noviherbaspirillum sp. TaxID=1926288 RepID=UPI002DDD5C77|nr:hypothetical protein [Noviherbaspirillum sp.]HEV2610110.1 hypothetical protein [Noviherbaspirillum sp.]
MNAVTVKIAASRFMLQAKHKARCTSSALPETGSGLRANLPLLDEVGDFSVVVDAQRIAICGKIQGDQCRGPVVGQLSKLRANRLPGVKRGYVATRASGASTTCDAHHQLHGASAQTGRILSQGFDASLNK